VSSSGKDQKPPNAEPVSAVVIDEIQHEPEPIASEPLAAFFSTEPDPVDISPPARPTLIPETVTPAALRPTDPVPGTALEPRSPARSLSRGTHRVTHVPEQPLAPISTGRRRPGSGVSKPAREYPRMKALLTDPGALPPAQASAKVRAPPVPGTFFPSAPVRTQAFEPATGEVGLPSGGALDAMLESMAEGLLIGSDGQGGSEVHVTLRDEFFRGTELRILVEGGEVRAQLVPPDRDTYRLLSAELHRLRSSLEERGLRVGSLQVVEP
jgi:hypothetical protein